ncbi:RNA-binding protein [Candidatus Pacearchaeota archaeon CG10_big_fil_rev_8_21_14_0_10_35_219]|nr:RNA-binding protein [Candidatus Pacearchaeota archaeon]OIO42220.1 MAG: hypothetical protein AUJ63_02975 [Candidatus Pacearchaeota archaeon CG1_02_35_32]PIO07311.1 MAG: RNA-binding protein [Candidatus Pacearchaeota archaeon CG10_big_fil_rev_8_21_14_0_10_35_219]PIY81361.1 MAG: RNA-binding protein [Candidatus Pacearchaeota archaeon CG_4_10_14_0_8_um_filter_35_169]PIZ79817.1 MAG: RNA-binding protein [Candidatus Pacearchaeota archaeon CG_4_10_14_0_2_um_filter_35_33]PJA69839.1 MAG: RNA-binding pr
MKVYVGNLPFSIRNDKLKEIFSEFGEVTEAVVITDRYSGRSKGFGFVTFANDDDAKKAIDGMDGKEVEGRSLKVNEAKPREDSGFRRDDGPVKQADEPKEEPEAEESKKPAEDLKKAA